MKTIVVKIGGSTLGSHDTTLEDLVALQKTGFFPVVVHGGGTKITQWLEDKGIPSTFVKGHRVTDMHTLEVVISVLCGLVNKDLVATINSLGGRAIGLSGVDGSLIEGTIKDVDLGYVGNVSKINTEPILTLLNAGYIPVIAPCAFRVNIHSYEPVKLLNINADVVAADIAVALHADRLIFLTDVEGVRDASGVILPKLTSSAARTLIESEVVQGGMIPKVEACLYALSTLHRTQIIDGRRGKALMSVFTGKNMGTIITND